MSNSAPGGEGGMRNCEGPYVTYVAFADASYYEKLKKERRHVLKKAVVGAGLPIASVYPFIP